MPSGPRVGESRGRVWTAPSTAGRRYPARSVTPASVRAPTGEEEASSRSGCGRAKPRVEQPRPRTAPPTHAVPVTCPGTVQSAPGTCRQAIQTAARRAPESAPALPGDRGGLGMEHRIVGPGPYRATKLVSERVRAGRTPRHRHRRDPDGAHPLGSAGAAGRASAGVAAPHPAPQPADQARRQLLQGGMDLHGAFSLNGKRTPGDGVPLCPPLPTLASGI